MTELNRINAIPCTYSGVTFRSLLEARYAILFDLLSLPWAYEPLELGDPANGTAYIPDFIVDTTIWSRPVQVPGPTLVEVRPHLTASDYRPSINKIARSGWRGPAIVASPIVHSDTGPWGIEHSIGFGHPSVTEAHAEPGACEWYRVGFATEGEAAGMFTFGGLADLRSLMKQAHTRSQWWPEHVKRS